MRTFLDVADVVFTQDSEDLSQDPLVIKGQRYWKHDDHWYEDGNMAFLVETTAFRLHGSVLSRRSPVMANLLSLPLPAPPYSFQKSDNSDVILEGVPLVVLHDKAGDFAHVLDFIYPNSLPAARTEHLDVHDLMGMVRLAGKYLIDDLLEWAVSKLGKEFLLLPETRAFKEALEDYERYRDPHFCVQIIQFSRECSLPQFLPLAFYALATTDWDMFPGAATCLEELSSEDQCRIHEGRRSMTREVFGNAFRMPENHGAPGTCRSWLCPNPRPTMWDDAEDRWDNLMHHPLEELEDRLSLDYPSLCEACKTKLKRRTREFRGNLVRQLTEFFTLEEEDGSGSQESW